MRIRVLFAVILLSLSSSYGRKHEHHGEGFSIDLPQPYDQVLAIVQEVVNDGIIRGTFQYKGTSELDGAQSAQTSDAFPHWREAGQVLYKTRPHTLSPAHFYESADEGIVVVRYVAQPLSPVGTRLRIDAIFQEDSRHHSHASDGAVENSEFEAISTKIKEAEARAARRTQESARGEEQQRLDELQAELDRENAALTAALRKQQQLEQQVQQLEHTKAARVRTATAELQAAPYAEAKILELLSQGNAVTVLAQVSNWYRVQSSNGEQGWVYRLMLELGP
jgi:Bacterial SH3 domain